MTRSSDCDHVPADWSARVDEDTTGETDGWTVLSGRCGCGLRVVSRTPRAVRPSERERPAGPLCPGCGAGTQILWEGRGLVVRESWCPACSMTTVVYRELLGGADAIARLTVRNRVDPVAAHH